MAKNEDNQTFENVEIDAALSDEKEAGKKEIVEAMEKVAEAINEMRESMHEDMIILPMQIAEEIRNLADG
jgi:hypothetical protein